ncbi:MAG: bifunctional alpha,alpha-trehalose-phosphate synthase (UDP-forming)/trehalose-phosphatase [Cyclobacteriaceae bacterium]
MAKTIIVSNRLPVRVKKEEGKLKFASSEGGLATGLGSVYKSGGNIWLGWPGLLINQGIERINVTKQLEKENMVPIFLTQSEIKKYYEGFSNETIWPNFHYFNQYSIYKESLWQAYVEVNNKFCEELVKIAKPEDTIWIHDYQLLLLPQLVRQRFPEISIGFFQHIPFPSYEIFRLLPWRRELLNGMLGADLVGFHTYDDMRHFLSSVSRLAGIPYAQGQVVVENRKVTVDAFPMGIDYEKYEKAAAAPETIEREIRYRTSLGDPQLILSIDRLDYSKGIPQRLEAFEMFLERYPEFREKVSLLMVVVPSRDRVPKYQELKEAVDLLVGRINGKFGRIKWTPIHYFYRSLPLPALSAFYRMAHVALVTPKRDGMNLICKEFIASKINKKGVLILSEMCGASKELSDAILINPNDINAIVEALRRALTMPEEEQIRHIEVMQNSLRRYNIHHWVDLFMQRLDEVKQEQASMATKLLDRKITGKAVESFNKAQQKLLFLDYDGTLTPFNDEPQAAFPDKELLGLLNALTKIKDCRVVIISGRDRKTLQKWLGDLNLDFIGEHGVWVKEQGGGWDTSAELSEEWKSRIKPVLELYVNRTPGSFIEEKNYSLVWHYRKVETGLGELRTRELSSHLKYLSSNMNLHVLEGDMVVEIKSSEVNKGRSASRWLEKYPADHVIAIGDDWTDEDTFKAMPPTALTIKVGSSNSAAQYNVLSHRDVRSFLKELI